MGKHNGKSRKLGLKVGSALANRHKVGGRVILAKVKALDGCRFIWKDYDTVYVPEAFICLSSRSSDCDNLMPRRQDLPMTLA